MALLVYKLVYKQTTNQEVTFRAHEKAAVDTAEQDDSKDVPRDSNKYFVEDIDEDQADPRASVSL